MESRADNVAELQTIAAFLAPAYTGRSGLPLLVCLYTGEIIPRFSVPMVRIPAPPVGVRLDAAFPQSYRHALLINPEIHDGAILAARNMPSDVYAVTGWSYRLYPPAAAGPSAPNRGSAFHSCLAMSALREVDGVLLFARGESLIFVDSRITGVPPPSHA
jgi:hypothetical protein